MKLDKRVAAVEIVRVDNRERFVYDISGCQHRVTGSPRLGPAVRNCKAFRNVFKSLERVIDFYRALNTVCDRFAEILEVFLLDDELSRWNLRMVSIAPPPEMPGSQPRVPQKKTKKKRKKLAFINSGGNVTI